MTSSGRGVKPPQVLTPIVVILALIVVGMIHFFPTVARLGELRYGGGFLIVRLLIAIVLIIAIGGLGGWVARRCGQPRVVGEMVAGITLGPSLLGQLAPGAQQWVFRSELIPHLGLIAQLVIIIFVFLLGANLPLELLRGSGRRITALGVGMVAIPVLCGILLAAGLLGVYRPDDIALVPFLLFVGVSMGVTAFPVLVRILAEHGLTRLRIGALGLTVAGIGDAIAWVLLIVVVTVVRGDSAAVAIRTVALVIAFAAAVWTFFRPALRRFLAFSENNSAARFGAIPVLVLSAVSGGFITEWIGVHAIFGAFMVGMAVPRKNPLVRNLTQTTERGVNVALPLFFAVVGLNVQINFLSNLQGLVVCGLVILVAMTSKIGTTTLIARLTKLTWRDSVGLGVMMNCRGLTELVVITTGLSLGIIEQNLFAIFVAMTLVTTMMTGPLLGWLDLNEEEPSRVKRQPSKQRQPLWNGLSRSLSPHSRASEFPVDSGDRGDRKRPSKDHQDDLEHFVSEG
ncbi:MAG: cation:proton antiporter [Pseudonocardia sp.]